MNQSIKFSKNANFIIASEDNTVLGFCAYYANDTIRCIAYLSMIILIPIARGKGIGEMILNKMIGECKSKGMRIVQLEVASDNNQALRFYRKHNFTKIKSLTEKTDLYALSI